MLAIALEDARRFVVPDWLSLPAIPIGLLASGRFIHDEIAHLYDPAHLLGACAGGLMLWMVAWLYRRWRGEDGLGLGDVKLAAVAGAWVGMDHLSLVLLLAASLALVAVAIGGFARRQLPSRRAMVPFGAFLAPSIWIVWWLAIGGHLD